MATLHSVPASTEAERAASVTSTLVQLTAQADGLRREIEELVLQLPALRPVLSAERETELLEANERLVLAALDAQDVELRVGRQHREQIHFLAMVAHELRNPLAPIKLATELMARFRGDELLFARQQQIVKRQLAHMGRLIEDLLDGSRVTTGTFSMLPERVDMAEVLRQSIENSLPARTARNQGLTCKLMPGPIAMMADASRLAQIFGNLLDNASKYTPKGGELRIESGTSDKSVTVSFADDGIGIAADMLPRIFELFVQDARAKAVDRGGLGIGLAIVRDLVEAHGGSVVGTSGGPGMGSCFVVTLPLAVD